MKLFEDGDPCFAPMLNALFAAFRGTAVMSGCEVSATGTSRTVSITAGSVQINGEVIAVGAGSVTLGAGSTFDRYDLVSVNASGSKIVTKGATKRKCPTQPANTCLLAIVFVPAGATVIATGNVYDARMLISLLVAQQIAASQYVGGSNLLMQASASDTLVNASEGLVSVTGTTPTKVKEIWLSPQNSAASTYRIKFNLAATDYVTVLGAIYVNGVQRGTSREAATMSYTEFSEDISGLKGGDLVQLYLWGADAGWTARSTYFRIYADFAPVAFSATPSNITTL